MAVLQESNNDTDLINATEFIDSSKWCAQTFTAGAGYTITSVKLVVNWFSSIPAGDLTVSIKAVDGSNKPTGADLCSGTVACSSLPEHPIKTWTEITFGVPYVLTKDIMYAIVIRTAVASPDMVWREVGGGSTYPDGTMCDTANAGSFWSIISASDMMFETWGNPPVPGKPTNPSPTDAASSITLDESPLSWDASDPAADTYEVYFREQGDGWGLIGIAQAGVSFTIDFGTLDYGITYEWRIDATNVTGTTTGDTWSFDTITFNTILPGASGGSGGGGGGGGSGEESSPNGENNMLTLRRLVAAADNKIWYEDI